jgi:peptidyl-prolyl cis-trans isomerase SurA
MISRVLALAAFTLAYTPSLSAQTVAMTIYGETITEDEIEQRTKLNLLMHKQATRQEVIGKLAEDKDNIKRAKRANVLPPDDQVEKWLEKMAAQTRPGFLAKSLEDRGIRPETLKSFIKADAARSSLTKLRYYHFQDELRVR